MFRVLNATAILLAPFLWTKADATNPEARQVFAEYTQCAAKNRPKAAQEVVLSTLANGEIMKTYPSLITPMCLSGANVGSLKLPGDFVRYGLAEALIRREYARGLPADIGFAAPLQHRSFEDPNFQPKPGKKLKPKEQEELENRRKEAIGFRYLSILGECVARQNPAGALRLALSRTDSAEELAAFEPLKPAISQCVTAGQTLSFDKAAIRGSIALNLYRLAKAPRIPSTSQ